MKFEILENNIRASVAKFETALNYFAQSSSLEARKTVEVYGGNKEYWQSYPRMVGELVRAETGKTLAEYLEGKRE